MTAAAFVSAVPLVLRNSAPIASRRHQPLNLHSRRRAPPIASLTAFDPLHLAQAEQTAPSSLGPSDASDASFNYALLTRSLACAAAFGGVGAANAVPEALQEAFKTIPASLVHPGVMWTMFAGSVYAGWLGWQSRSIRSAEPEERKRLVKAKVTQRHFAVVSLLAAMTTVFTFEGMGNTFNRADKLFPGAHLYTGLGLVAAFSCTAALVPYMQKGKNGARNAHLAFGVLIVSMFAWQAKTGMDIVGKLLKWT